MQLGRAAFRISGSLHASCVAQAGLAEAIPALWWSTLTDTRQARHFCSFPYEFQSLCHPFLYTDVRQGGLARGAAGSPPPTIAAGLVRYLAKKAKHKGQPAQQGTAAEAHSTGAGHGAEDGAFDVGPYESKMASAHEHLLHEFTGVRTGRASPAVLDGVSVQAYGERTSLPHVATVVMRGPRTLAVTVYDRDMTSAVVEAIRASPLGFSPREDGAEILVAVPEMSPETRTAMVKLAHQFAERARVTVRQIRKHAMSDLKGKHKPASEDERKNNEKQVDDLTKAAIAKVDSALARKETELQD